MTVETRHKKECLTIQDIITKNDYPTTVCLLRRYTDNNNEEVLSGGENGDGEIHTIQACEDISEFIYIEVDNAQKKFVQVSSLPHVYYVPIENDFIYRSFNDIYNAFKIRKHRWMVCMEMKQSQGITIQPGQVFKILRFSRKCCLPCCQKNKRVKIKIYPCRRVFWLPLDLAGDFRKCDSPKTMKREAISLVLEKNTLPILVRSNEDTSGHFKCLLELTVQKVLVSCIKNNSVPEVQTFPLKDAFLRRVLPYASSVDVLSGDDLNYIRKKALVKEQYKTHPSFSYEYLQIQNKQSVSELQSRQLPPIPTESETSKSNESISHNSVPEIAPPVPRRDYSLSRKKSNKADFIEDIPLQFVSSSKCMLYDHDDTDPEEEKDKEISKNEKHLQQQQKQHQQQQLLLQQQQQLHQKQQIQKHHQQQIQQQNQNIPDNLVTTSTTSETAPLVPRRDCLQQEQQQQQLLLQQQQKYHQKQQIQQQKQKQNIPRNLVTTSTTSETAPLVWRRDYLLPKQENNEADLVGVIPTRSFSKYKCTPMLYDPDDTDPEEEEEDEDEEEQQQALLYQTSQDDYLSDDSFDDDDDYENAARIQINDRTRK